MNAYAKILPIIEGLESSYGHDFFNRMVMLLSKTTNSTFCFIATFDKSYTHAETIALYDSEKLIKNFNYKLADTPCDSVIKQRDQFITHNAQSEYPKDDLLVKMNIEAYIGSRLLDQDGKLLGIIVALYDKPIKKEDAQDVHTIFKLLKGRICAELSKCEKDVLLTANSIKLKKINEKLNISTERLTQQVSTDYLTGLSNRYAFEIIINKKLSENQEFTVFLIDIDNFKYINDSYGHDIGNKTLKEVSNRFKNYTKNGNTIARISGDEFGFISNNIKSKIRVNNIAIELQNLFKQPIIINRYTIRVSISIGIARAPTDGSIYSDILKYSDIALYNTKRNRKNKFKIYNDAMGQAYSLQVQIAKELFNAIQNNELELNFQPIIDIKNGETVNIETLARWSHPKLGDIPPDKFIPIAEKNGTIIMLGEWVLKTALSIYSKLILENNNFSISINVSPKQLETNEFLNLIQEQIEYYNLPAKKIILELTETAILSCDDIIENLYALKKMGILIAIDDFGTGYSSLMHLVSLPIDIIKIDKTFTQGCPDNQAHVNVFKAIIQLSKVFNVKVIAEGVETKKQLDFLNKNSCNLAQGFYYTPALSVDSLNKYHSEIKPKSSHKAAWKLK
ncbi:MAG: diguanylate cyclase (GGDEF)-like protein [Francisellaceae bacterium]|jgi:diguanylate cyclase (GGDEF)-like protein